MNKFISKTFGEIPLDDAIQTQTKYIIPLYDGKMYTKMIKRT
jgi:hypothetical protein